MADHGRSSDNPYPNGQYPPGRSRPMGPPSSVRRTSAQAPAWPDPPHAQAPESPSGPPAAPAGPRSPGQPQTTELPPPEWADPAVGRRWTQSWRVRPTGTHPALPQERPAPPPGRRPTGAWPAAGQPAQGQSIQGYQPAPGQGPRPT